MWISIVLCTCVFLSFILNGFLENIFIVLAVLAFYKQVIIDKDYKYLPLSLLISFIGLNCLLMIGMRDYVSFNEIDTDEDKEKSLILLVSEGEHRKYNIKEQTTKSYYENGYSSYFSIMKDLYDAKGYYNEFGTSDFKEETNYISRELRKKMGNNYMVVNSYLYSSPYFENALEVAVSNGYKNIIICPLLMTEGKDYEILKERYENIDLSNYDLDSVEILEPFYKSNNLAMLYANEILESIDSIDDDAGVLLIGLEDENNLEQDVLFREKIRDYILQEEKKHDIQIKLPLLENNKKDIIKSGEELLEYGIDTLYVAMPTSLIDSIYIKHLVNSILEQLDMGNTKFFYIDPKEKLNVIVEDIYTRITLINQVGG